ncbi:MAG: hypothetical protein AAGL49_11265, partial [Pseudomonadota bacterium]
MRCLSALAIACLFGFLAPGALAAETDDEPGVLVVYDSSNSMWGALADETRKYEAGRTALDEFLKGDLEGRDLAFRAYGHRRKDDCRDSELVVGFAEPAAARVDIGAAVAEMRPMGKTPITYSLEQAVGDFDGRPGDILLISDGVETCDADPCQLVAGWREAGIDIRVHVVGVGLTQMESAALACIADASGGSYFDVESAEGFQDALKGAGEAIEAGEAAPEPTEEAFELRIVASDAQGRSYIVAGTVSDADGVGEEIRSHRRNALPGPGEYVLEVGPVLQDGSIFEPVRKDFAVEAPGQTVVEVTVQRPAIVSAFFTEAGEEHPGAFVTAYKDGEEAFGFRAFDEALARPGTYEFRARPNDDNELTLSETLVAGETTELAFELVRTVKFYVVLTMPNGETVQRNATLWRDGEKLYDIHGANGGEAQPGVYELRSEDQNAPLAPSSLISISTGA